MPISWKPEPVMSDIMTVKDEWIDYNGHLNMAYYNVLLDAACDHVFIQLGMGPEYAKEQNASFFTAEAHVCYIRELSAGMPVKVSLQLIDFDEKRAHFYQEMYHAEEGWLSATSEQLCLHVDLGARKVVPWPEDVQANLQALADAQNVLPRPERAGRHIEIKKKS